MKYKSSAIAVLAACAALGLWALPAHGQSTGRQAGRMSGMCQNGSSSSSGSTAATSTAAVQTTSPLAGSIAATTSTTSGANLQAQIAQMYARRQALSTSGYARQTYLAGRQSQSINQGAGLVSAQRTSTNEPTVKWSGDPSNVQRIYFATLDANGQVIEQKAVTQLPVQANLNLN